MTTQHIKKAFAIIYLIYSIAISITGIHIVINHGLDLSWAGLFLISLSVIVVNGDVLMKRAVTGHRYLTAVTISVLLGFVVTVSSLLGGLAVGRGAFVAAVIGVIAFAAYRFWFVESSQYSNQDQPPAT
jgi:hypothetical protein